MTYPTPPPDRMHLQYQPVPPPHPGQQPPPQMGPGGAYGPVQHSPGQPAPGMAGGMPPAGGMAAGGSPERPATRPGVATFAVVVVWAFAALSAWGVYVNVRNTMRFAEYGGIGFFDVFFHGDNFFYLGIPVLVYPILVICAVITAPLLTKGSTGGRYFGTIWSIIALPLAILLFVAVMHEYLRYKDFILPDQPNPYPLMIARHVALVALVVMIFVLMLLPGVKAWTPVKAWAPPIMMVPTGHPQAPQQPGPYGQPQQQYQPPPQQPPYPPQQQPRPGGPTGF